MENTKLFQTLCNEKVLDDWAELLDWLFDNNRLDKNAGWSTGYVGQFTKTAKHYFLERGAHYGYDSKKKLSFPEKSVNYVTLLFSKGEGEGRDLVRHIRNGIAHGRTELQKHRGEIYIQIKDYSSNTENEQTALFFFPLSYIMKVFECYKKVEHKMLLASNQDAPVRTGKNGKRQRMVGVA